MTKFRKLPAAIAAGVIAFFGITAVNAATDVTWTAAQMDSTASGISTEGTLKYAYTAASSSLTVNDVTFSPWGGTTGNSDVAITAPTSGYQSSSAGNESLSNDYGTLLNNDYWFPQLGSYVLTFNNLTIGTHYLAQIFIHNNNGRLSVTVADYSPTTVVYPHYDASNTDWKYGGVLTCDFVASSSSESFTLTCASDTPAVFNAVQLRDVTTGPTISNPSFTIANSVSGKNATVSLSSIKKGTDGEGTAANNYDVYYKLGESGNVETAAEDQTATSYDIALSNLADASYTVYAWIVNDASRSSVTNSATFTINTAVPEPTGDWTISPMDETGSTISTDGDFVYGYAVNGCTVNGVTFSRQIPVVGSSGNITVSPAAGGSAYGDYDTEGAASPYGSLLSHGSYWTAPASLTLTFAGLTVGKTYQVQIVAHKSGASDVTVSAEGSAAQHICTVDGDVTYKYGASILGSFTATAQTQTVAVTFAGSGKGVINAIQLRDITNVVVDPSIGSVRASKSGSTATIKVTNIVMGTNAEGTQAASSYTLAYDFTNVTTTVGTSMTATSATFDLTNLAPGTYTCNVTMTTDVGRSATGFVTFMIRDSQAIADDALKISEICPKPTALDPNGRESGWIELWNSGTEDVDLADYEIVRANRGKKLKVTGEKLASRIVKAGEYTLVYMSESYDNVDSGKVKIYENDVMVCPVKINPKKFPLVALCKGETLLEKFIVPVDLPDNQSFAPAGGKFAAYAGETVTAASQVTNESKFAIFKASAISRVILPTATPGAANDRAGETPYGPNAGPFYEMKHDASDWKAWPLAKVNTDYTVKMAINPMSDETQDEIASVKLLYRANFDAIKSVEMDPCGMDATNGQFWCATIPAADIPKAGTLIRWAAQVTDESGNVWRTPSFRNPDDGYEWYGTLVEPTEDQVSKTLPTWHLIISDVYNDRDKQYDSLMNNAEARKRWPYGVRCGIFDSQTSNYYDNVRIDVRGNTTVEFTGANTKLSHGLRFSKVHPMQCTDPFSGEEISVRKTSLLAEYQDPSNLRSSLSMHLRRMAGQPIPFGYPIRVMMNGAFYQMDQHTNRFTDELLSDYYGLDENGCAFKNVGTVGGVKDTGGGSTQVLPDDGTDATAIYDAFENALSGLADYSKNTATGPSEAKTNEVQKNVVRLYDLPSWINFLSLSRITQECDDDTSTLNVYYDRYGTGTWSPMAYDVHQSFGVYWIGNAIETVRPGLMSTDDTSKSHPFHGGLHCPVNYDMGNRAYEAVYQTPKFRRMLLRRLRTLMDTILKEPGTAKEDTPFWRDYVMPLYEAMKADDLLDRAKYAKNRLGPLHVWDQTLTFEEGVADMWDNYIVPRRNHFYVTHSITNTARTVGYGVDLNAGIPLAQSATAALKAKFSAAAVAGGVVIRNLNEETVDMSGWKLSGAIRYAFPAGAVIDRAEGGVPGEIFIVTNRMAYIAANDAALTDQVILGNAEAGLGTAFILNDAAGEEVIGSDAPASEGYEFVFAGDYDTVQSVTPTGAVCKIVLADANLKAGLVIPAGVTAKINATTNTVNTIASISASDAEVRFTGEGTVKLSGADTLATVSNLVVKSGTLQITSTGVASTKTPVVNVLGFVEQTGGRIDLDIGVASGNQIYGIYLANKDLKNANDKNLGVVYALFDGGEFNATVGGTKSAAVYVNKGSVDTTFKGGETVTAQLAGPEARFANVAGDLDFGNCIATVTMPDAYASITNCRAFKSDKSISISKGHYVATLPGVGTEVFSAGDAITVDGGTFELTASDDCFSALNNITVNGGLFYAVSTDDDVFDSNGDMEINGGTILAYATANGHEAFDVEPEEGSEGTTPHQLRINGGVIFATGGKDSAWPANVASAVANLYTAVDLDKDDYSEKYLTVENESGIVYTAKLPAFPKKSCALLVSCPNRTADAPTTASTKPTEGDQNFHELYIYEKAATNQGEMRLLEIYGSTLTNDVYTSGDDFEYIVLTNVSAKTVSLEGLVVTSAKYDTDKGKADTPKLNITLGAKTITAHGSVRLEMADYPWSKPTGWSKITNGSIYMTLTDSAGNAVQTAYATFDNERYPKTDMLGAALVAKRFDAAMLDTTEYWKSSEGDAPSPSWPDDPATEITDATRPADLGITGGAFTNATTAELRNLATWGKAYGIPCGGAAVNSLAFDDAGNPENEVSKAYLLNCALAEVPSEEADFKFGAITPGTVPSIDGSDYNGSIRYQGSTDLKTWDDLATTGHNFYRARLTR